MAKTSLDTYGKGGATIFKVGFFFDPPTFGTWGDIKQDITVFITAIMTYKRYAYLHQMIIT